MRKYLLIAAALFGLASPARAADSTVAAMTAASALAGTELIYCVQGGADRKCTPAQIATYFQSLVSGDCTIAAGVITCTKTSGVTFKALATATPGANVATAVAVALSAPGGLTTTVATGTAALGVAAIAAGACGTATTVAATGVATTDVVKAGFVGDPTGVAGYGPTAMLTVIPYPSAGNVNFKQCNLTSASITPSALTINWSVSR